MIARVFAPLRHFIPDLGEISVRERLRACAGAMLGLLVTGFVSRAALGNSEGLPLLIAPMGASAVLLFAVPSSPLAQPWSILGGNVVAALIGITAARLIDDPIAGAAVACAGSIGAMLVLRCLHPPSGAVALTAVLGGPVVHAAGYGFAIWPVGLNSVLLLAVALAFNNMTGRRYPHLAHRQKLSTSQGTAMTGPEARVAAALRRRDELLDVSRGELLELFEEVTTTRDAFLGLRCSEVMRRDPDAISSETSIEDALDRMDDGSRSSLPVVGSDGGWRGMVSRADLVRHSRPTRAGRRAARLFRRSLRFEVAPTKVAEILSAATVHAAPETLLRDLLPVMLDVGPDCIPVIDADRRLVGLMTPFELLRAISANHVAPPEPQPRSPIQRS